LVDSGWIGSWLIVCVFSGCVTFAHDAGQEGKEEAAGGTFCNA